MKIRGLKYLRSSGRWLRSRFIGGTLILGYHRISDSGRDPYSICVTPQHFSEQLDIIGKHARPMKLQELVQALKNGKVPTRAVVITFDDGYADNLYVAKPLLERYEIPATVFVTSGYLGREFWWDQLARMVMNPAAVPKQLSLTVNKTVHELQADAAKIGRSKNPSQAWNLRVLTWLYGLLQTLSEGERQLVMEQIKDWAGATTHDDIDGRAVSRDEVLQLANGNLVEIGGHSVTHALLTRLPLADQKAEVQKCKTYLEELLNRAVTSFAYPHGSLSKPTVKAVRDAGYACGCTSLNDIVWSRSNCFQLPRFWPTDCDGASFARWLNRWVHD
jgi:peptidoglycan/xylan/chitin deacetylase (PgdA/CDA1 family)